MGLTWDRARCMQQLSTDENGVGMWPIASMDAGCIKVKVKYLFVMTHKNS